MITVYIWNYRGTDVALGHASMLVDGGEPAGQTYISWWPESDATSPINRCGGDEWSGPDNSGPAILNRTYADDKRDEGRAADHIVRIDGLDATAIKRWWSNLLGQPNPRWCLRTFSCSTVVARALQAGGSERYAAFPPLLSWWDPASVLRYAIEVQQAISNPTSTTPRTNLDGGVAVAGTGQG